ncbi:HIT family protein [Glycomyces sambucus]|nr:HIT family protein [Glycomyces sambucus]
MTALDHNATCAPDPEAEPGAVGCDFCGIAAEGGETHEVLRTDTVIGFFPLFPAAIGHTLLIPRAHVPDIWSLEPALAGALAEASVAVAHAIRSALRPDGLSVVQSNGRSASQTVMHLHVHLVPRWEDDALPRIWPTRSAWPEHRLAAAGAAIRSRLD